MTDTIEFRCCVVGCDNKFHTQGFCSLHYDRYKRGTLKDRHLPKYKSKDVIKMAQQDTDECIFFTSKDGKKRTLFVDGKNHSASRAVWIAINGHTPPRDIYILHRCGNGHKGCINIKHLYPGTAKQNAIDRNHEHNWLSNCVGENNKLAKLKNDHANSIRKAYSNGGYTQAELAREYGVSQVTISNIVRNKSYVS